MKTIYLVRHCEYANPDNIYPGRLPLPLSEIGKKRAVKLHEYFLDKNISKIYSSSVVRCKETSNAISKGAIPIVFDLRLAETLSAYQGYKVKGDLTDNNQWIEYHSHVEELGGETFLDVRKRIVSFFEEVVKKNEGNIIICSHDDPLYTLFNYLIKEPLPPINIDILHTMEAKGSQPKGSVRPVIIEDKISFKPQELVVLEV